MHEVAIEVKFDAAHRLLNYKGKCSNLHGHSYVAIVVLSRQKLVDSGFVVDFGYVKEFVKEWIGKNWDHATILNPEDELVGVLRKHGMPVFTMDCVNPTAEHMAATLYNVVKNACPSEFTKVIGITEVYPLEMRSEEIENPIIAEHVTIKETTTSWATFKPGERDAS